MNSKATATLALIIAAGIFFTYVSPTWSGSIAAKRATIASDDRALMAADTYRTKQNQLAAKHNEINPDSLTRLEALLPNSVGNISLVHDLDILATKSGITLSTIDVAVGAAATKFANASTTSRANPVGSGEISLSAVGTYNAFQTFLERIEKSQRLLDVKDILIKGSETGVYIYHMKISLYWLR